MGIHRIYGVVMKKSVETTDEFFMNQVIGAVACSDTAVREKQAEKVHKMMVDGRFRFNEEE